MPYYDSPAFGIHYHAGRRGPAIGIVRYSFRYASTIDPSITNLYAHCAYDNRLTGLPIVILMHGYDQDASSMTPWIMEDMARYGFFAVAPGMRGRNNAAGVRDTSARELHDIIDAVEYVKTTYAAFVDPNNVNVSGYSGGGGNVFGLAAKFPDYFRVLVSHFGIADYGYDPTSSWWVTNTERQASLQQWIGSTPSGNGPAYHSRAHHLGTAKNLQGGYLYMFHDSADSNVPVAQSNLVKTQMDAASRTNYTLSITGSADPTRWLHASPDADKPVRLTRNTWGPPIKAGTYPAWSVADTGSLMVQGYIRTKKFTIWLGNGTEEVANVAYNVTAGTYTVTPLTGQMDVQIKQGTKTATQTISAETTITVT